MDDDGPSAGLCISSDLGQARASSNMSLRPPEKPRQLASTINGKPSPVLKSWMACAVLYAESGNQTCPACICTCGLDSRFAGSARMSFSTSLSRTTVPRSPSPFLAPQGGPASLRAGSQ